MVQFVALHGGLVSFDNHVAYYDHLPVFKKVKTEPASYTPSLKGTTTPLLTRGSHHVHVFSAEQVLHHQLVAGQATEYRIELTPSPSALIASPSAPDSILSVYALVKLNVSKSTI